MGNQCLATSQLPPRSFEERITATNKLPQFHSDSLVGLAKPLRSVLIESERPTAISPTDVEVEVEMQPPPKVEGSILVGPPELEDSIKQMWKTLPSFLPSYQTKEPYREPFVIDLTQEIYYGQWKEGLPDGRGFLYSPHSCLYEGSWKDGVKNGRARMIFTESHVFEGTFNDGRLYGEFTYTSPKLKFNGSYKSRQLNGTIQQQTEAYSYRGTLNSGKREQGELKWSTNFYSGAFDDEGSFTNRGTLKTEVGTYVGEFQNGMKHGRGEFIWKSGLRYQGTYEQNRKHGFGTLFLSDGEISYEGHWRNDVPHGRGHTVVDGVVQPEADWQEGLERSEIDYWQRPLPKK